MNFIVDNTSDLTTAELIDRLNKVKLLLMDCDGVLTDGRLYFSERGEKLKVFHVRDGQGLAMWHEGGFKSGIISGRGAGAILARRAAELGIAYVKVMSEDKRADFREILDAEGLTAEETAFIGDDIGDIELMKLVGVPIAVADAVDEAKHCAAFVTKRPGGCGAVREVTDLLIASRKK